MHYKCICKVCVCVFARHLSYFSCTTCLPLYQTPTHSPPVFVVCPSLLTLSVSVSIWCLSVSRLSAPLAALRAARNHPLSTLVTDSPQVELNADKGMDPSESAKQISASTAQSKVKYLLLIGPDEGLFSVGLFYCIFNFILIETRHIHVWLN